MEESVIEISLFMLSQITYQDTGGVDMRNMLSTESIVYYKIHQVEEKSSSQKREKWCNYESHTTFYWFTCRFLHIRFHHIMALHSMLFREIV